MDGGHKHYTRLVMMRFLMSLSPIIGEMIRAKVIFWSEVRMLSSAMRIIVRRFKINRILGVASIKVGEPITSIKAYLMR